MRIPVSFILVLALLSVTCPVLVGQQRDPIPKKVLERFEFMAGKWNESAQAPGGPQKTLLHERVWSPGKHCLIVTWKAVINGATLDASGVMGWDSTANQVSEHWFMSDGTFFLTCYHADKMKDKVWGGTSSWIEPGGKRINAKCQLKKVDEDKFVWTAEWKDGQEAKTLKVITTRIKD